jgi:hypothetical protein
MDVPFGAIESMRHASMRNCYVVVIAVKEFSRAAGEASAAAADVNECATVSDRGR